MALKIKAAVVEQFGKPLTLRQRDIPSPGAGQILVKTEACPRSTSRTGCSDAHPN
jgi:alcohol dehydrogenase, propanol-preferring